MYGAIIGDLAGSIYEYDQLKKIKSIETDQIIPKNSFYSDDTILTIAIMDAIKSNGDYEEYLKKYINLYKDYKPNFTPYFKTSFSPSLMKWAKSNTEGTSRGNGAMMRISPVAYLFDSEYKIVEESYQATVPSHNSGEAINSARTIALIIFYLRCGYSKEKIFDFLNIKVEYRPFAKFNTTCYETLNNCLYAFSISTSFEDAIKKTLLMGGDTDTNAAIVGSMAEALYGIDDDLKRQAEEKLPKEFIKVLRR